MTEEEILSIRICSCHRPYCKFYSGLIGDSGSSVGIEDLSKQLRLLKNPEKAIKHIEVLVNYKPEENP